jgi:hypothetical protein
MAQGNISLSISPFLVIYANTKKQLKEVQYQWEFVFDSNLAYLDHSLPPLGLFLQIKLNFLSLSQIHLLRHRERYSKRNWSKIQKLPLFPIIKHSPHKRHLEYFDKTKALTLLFQNAHVVADPFLALALNFSPFGIKHQNGIIFGPFNLIASPKSSIKSKRQ